MTCILRAIFGILLLVTLSVAALPAPRRAYAQHSLAPGLHDLVVFDPGVHERGLPKVMFRDEVQDAECTAEGADAKSQIVEIPPTVHVHRYYYSGDKEIQGPIISGGPTVIVAKHPKTGEQMYIDAVLPAGAPRIAYTSTCITYVYPDERVSIHFRHFPFDPQVAVVKYHSGRGVRRKINEHVSEGWTRARQHWQTSPVVESIKTASGKTHDALHNVGSGTVDLIKQVHSGAKAAVSIVPGVSPLLASSNDKVPRAKQRRIQAASSRNARTATQFVRTLR